jgi:hypothetical protein
MQHIFRSIICMSLIRYVRIVTISISVQLHHCRTSSCNLETHETIRNKCTNSLPIAGRTTLNGGSVTFLCPNQIITVFTATSGVQSTLRSSDTLTALRGRAPPDLPPTSHAVELNIVVFRSYPDANKLSRHKQ